MAKIITLDNTKKFLGTATALGIKYQSKIENSAAMIRELEKCALNLETATPDLKVINGFCRRVMDLVGQVQTEQVIKAVVQRDRGWMVSKDKETQAEMPGRYAEPYSKTLVPEKVKVWLEAQPSAMADPYAVRLWRQAGWALVDGLLKFPFGPCSCGKEPLLPYQRKGTSEWLPGRLGRMCYSTEADKTLSTVKRAHKAFPTKAAVAPKSPEAVKAAKKARHLQKQDKLVKELSELENSRPHVDGAAKKAKDAAKEARKQGAHPEAEQKAAKKSKGKKAKV